MTPTQITRFLKEWEPKKERTLVLVDYANVDKWKDKLGWKIGVRELAGLVKNFSSVKELRRFYYGSDYGISTTSTDLTAWSEGILQMAQFNNLTIVTKRVKYIHERKKPTKKCNLDVEMTLDLIKMRKHYDHIILFSGDGDMAHALDYARVTYQKKACVFGARDSIGSEIVDATTAKKIDKLMFAEDFEYRLNMRGGRR